MKKTLENGVVYVPGEAFYNDNPDTRTLRLSYSTVSTEGLMTAVERLAKSLYSPCSAPSAARGSLLVFFFKPLFLCECMICRRAKIISA